MAKVLVADDEYAICDAFSQLLELDGHEPILASTGRQAVAAFEQEKPALIFLDVQMPDMSGLDALKAIQELDPSVPVIIITAHGTVETAMQAMQQGAFDYLGKPLELDEIRRLIERALHQPEGIESIDNGPAPPQTDKERMVGTSRVMQEIFKMMSLLTSNDLTVLITGESGVGKDLVARGIHNMGPRANQPFVAVNCAAIPEHLIESELFGHEQGAFTGADKKRVGRFEAAGDGTIFLDEISELPYHLQAKLLRVLQDRSCEPVGSNRSIAVNARIIAATNHAFVSGAQPMPFREDLYYRLSLVNLHIPPLRERLDDIPELAEYFLKQAGQSLGKQLTGIEPAGITRLQQHQWPGNVREFEHTIQRSALMTRRQILGADDLVFDQPAQGADSADTSNLLDRATRMALSELLDDPSTLDGQPYHRLVEAVERTLIDEALNRCQGNQVAASEMLGINRTTLRKKLADD